MEAAVAFGALAQRFPRLQVDDSPPEHNPSISFRGLLALPVSLHG
jgi:cytochrome P450